VRLVVARLRNMFTPVEDKSDTDDPDEHVEGGVIDVE